MSMPRSGVGLLPRPGPSSPTRQPSATPQTKNKIKKKKIKTPATTPINPHGSVVAAVFDVSQLVLVSAVVVVAELMPVSAVVVVAELVPVSVVVVSAPSLATSLSSLSPVLPSSTYAEPELKPWSSSPEAPTTTMAPSELTATE
ncbi:unnamed protein product [Prorocentrum cordatum]|uniref:Uncharacterized protein n=1 Tax=Prorocentrum cordatum TaxID=2364126 RepID=A0ABN9W2I9_9DINO|nr:unnamed protein product [Polarella glacialis]